MQTPLFCCLCSKAFFNKDVLEAHLGMEHFDYYPFTCAYCTEDNGRAKFSTKAAIRRHCIQDHGLKKFYIRLWMSEEIESDEQEIQKCIQKSLQIIQNCAILPSSLFMASSQPLIEFPIGSSTSGSQPDERSLLVSVQDNSYCTNTSTLQAIEMHCEEQEPSAKHKNGVKQLDDDMEMDFNEKLEKSSLLTSSSTLTGGSLPTNPVENFRYCMSADQSRSQESSIIGTSRQMAALPRDASSIIKKERNVAKKTAYPTVEPQLANSLRRKTLLNVSQRSTTTNVSQDFAESNNKVRCVTCQILVIDSRINLRAHINTAHIRFPLFSCKGCDMHFYGRKNKIIEHIRRMHKNNVALITDRLAIYDPILSQKIREYFPTANTTYLQPFKRRNRPLGLKKKRPDTNRPPDVNQISMSLTNFLRQTNNSNNQTSEHDMLDGQKLGCGLSSNISVLSASRVTLVKKRNKTRRKIVSKGAKKERCLSSFAPQFSKAIFGDNSKKSVECSKCLTKIEGRFDYLLFNHVNINHLKFPVFECKGCGDTFQEYSGLSISSHMKNHHKGDTSFIQDNRQMYREPLQEACLQFFARKS